MKQNPPGEIEAQHFPPVKLSEKLDVQRKIVSALYLA